MKPSYLALSARALALAAWSCAGEVSSIAIGTPAAGSAGAGFPALQGAAAGAVAAAPVAGVVGLAANGGTGRLSLAGSPQYFRVVALTKNQWRNSVKDVFGLTMLPDTAESFQDAVSGTTDFTNNELVLDIDSRGWSDYQSAAEDVAQWVASNPATLGKLYAGTDAAGFIRNVGRRLYRRALTPQEVARLQSMFDLGAASSSFATGAEAVLEAMLQSPHFLYRTELGAPGTRLNGYELAAKLSLWLRDTSPDVALLDAAERGELDTDQGVGATAAAMLEEPVAVQVMRHVHSNLGDEQQQPLRSAHAIFGL